VGSVVKRRAVVSVAVTGENAFRGGREKYEVVPSGGVEGE
jgi:hypothetical protein